MFVDYCYVIMFVDYCYVITRHIQDGAFQVTKEATSKRSCHIFTGNWKVDKMAIIIFEFLGKSFSNLEKLFLDHNFPLTSLVIPIITFQRTRIT